MSYVPIMRLIVLTGQITNNASRAVDDQVSATDVELKFDLFAK
jgi:hypothetical protein